MKKSSGTYFTIFLVVLAMIAAYKMVDEYYGKPTPDYVYSGDLQAHPFGYNSFGNRAKPVAYLFFDYACEFCKKNLEYLSNLPEEIDHTFTLIQVPLPLGRPSTSGYKAAAQSICFYNTIKNLSAHHLLLNSYDYLGSITNTTLISKTGVTDSSSVAQYQRCVEQQDYKKTIDKNRSIARSMNIDAVPALLINDEIYIGAQPTHRLENIITSHLE